MEFIIVPATWEHSLMQIKATKLGSKCFLLQVLNSHLETFI